jgi:hypothetical protein
MIKFAVFYEHVEDAARIFAPERHGTVAVTHTTVFNDEIFSGHRAFKRHFDFTGFHRDTVVSHGNHGAENKHILAGFGIKSVGIRRIFRIDNG